MKVVILAGGYGTRINEITSQKPKPMIEIGGMPILWHIMKNYSHYGINDFIICCGYKEEIIKEYFSKLKEQAWSISCIDTGLETMTGGRIKRIKEYVNDTFCLTYGDTLNDLNITKLIEFHKENHGLATVTACQPPEKYGILEIEGNQVISFKERPPMEGVWVNGGFFVLEPEIFDYIQGDSTVWEKEPMNRLVKNEQLVAYKHTGFYQPMDTISEKNYLNKLWKSGNAPWKVW